MTRLRRSLIQIAAILAVAPAVASAAAVDPHFRLIAHRGGVVEDKLPDNSEAAFRAAVSRGYAGLEVDVRETKDGVLVLRHDPDLKAYYDDPRQLSDLTWSELAALPSKIAGHRTWRLDELLPLAQAAHLHLMLDAKAPHGASFCAKIEALLRAHNLLDRCYIIGTQDALDHFVGKARVGLKERKLRAVAAQDPHASERYFLFDHGTLTEATVRWAQAHQFLVIPSINTYHYYDAATMAGKSRAELAPIVLAAARRDIDKLVRAGVRDFQVDSEFDPFFAAPPPGPHAP